MLQIINPSRLVFLRLLPMEEPLKQFSVFREIFVYENKTKKYIKMTFVSARRLLQYFPLPDKNSRDISRYIYNFLRFFKIIMYIQHYFSQNP
jgi:hypothetical protein